MKCFSVDVCIYIIILYFSDCHDSTSTFSDCNADINICIVYSTCDYFCVCKML